MEPIKRSLPSEIKPAAGNGRLLRGLIPYNAPAPIFERGKAFTEVIRPGAFARSLAGKRDVISTFNHDVGRLLGRTASGTLRLTDGPEGLHYEVELPETAADVRELLARGDLRGSSFQAFPLKNGVKMTRAAGAGGSDLHELVGLDLFELGPVVCPAYPDSDATVRAGEPLPPPSGRLAAAIIRLMDRTR